MKITSKKELENTFVAKAAKEIGKKVDFKKEYLSASLERLGGDLLSFKVEKGKDGEVVFTKMHG